MSKPLLTIEHLTVHYMQSKMKEACVDVSLSVFPGERVGIVGESGCGKTTLLRTINGMLAENAKVSSGHLYFNKESLLDMSAAKWQQLRKEDVSMVFQDAMNSLNPSKTINRQMMELILHVQKLSRAEAKRMMTTSLIEVGLPNVETVLCKYPFELSGGMLQRISLAMSFLSCPKMILADEPTSSLDVVSSQHVLALLNEYVMKNSTALIMATHQLNVIAAMTDRIVVMYSGSIVEMGKTDEVLASPCHPYTRKLLCSMIFLDEKECCQSHHHNDVDMMIQHTEGCTFYSECSQRQPKCKSERPKLTEIYQQRKVACFYATQD